MEVAARWGVQLVQSTLIPKHVSQKQFWWERKTQLGSWASCWTRNKTSKVNGACEVFNLLNPDPCTLCTISGHSTILAHFSLGFLGTPAFQSTMWKQKFILLLFSIHMCAPSTLDAPYFTWILVLTKCKIEAFVKRSLTSIYLEIPVIIVKDD